MSYFFEYLGVDPELATFLFVVEVIVAVLLIALVIRFLWKVPEELELIKLILRRMYLDGSEAKPNGKIPYIPPHLLQRDVDVDDGNDDDDISLDK